MQADHVTTAQVLEAIRAIKGDFTTWDIAQRLAVQEYSVRGAVFWLRGRGLIKPAGEVERYSECRRGLYSVTVYREVPAAEVQKTKEKTPADFSAIYRAFGLGSVMA